MAFTLTYSVTGGKATITGWSGSPFPSNFVIPATDGSGNPVVSIDNNGFASRGITSITFPDNFLTISNSVFADNPITTLNFGNSLTTIGTFVFSRTAGILLTSLVFPSTITSIGNSAFFTTGSSLINTLTFRGAPPTFGTSPFPGVSGLTINAPYGFGWPSTVTIGGTTYTVTFYNLPVPYVAPTYATFQAFRPRSSSELLALRKQQVEKSLNTVPTILRQDSSEQTARVRKFASAVIYKHAGEGKNVVGDSATMVKYKASSVVQAQREGIAYRAAASGYEQRAEYTTPGCSTLLSDPVRFPKAVGCATLPFPKAAPRVVPFNPTVDLALRENDNKVVISRSTVNTLGCGANQ